MAGSIAQATELP